MAQPWATPRFDLHVEPTGPDLRKGLTKTLREAVRSGRRTAATEWAVVGGILIVLTVGWYIRMDLT
ncbi:hypothetical protein ACFVW5_02120 [Streptomyces sp. NPDC058232]|uniref:hypothetical protein n=1 Tax=unclassified Streptomyces TaxID=2593676 RepID=UPI003688E5CE